MKTVQLYWFNDTKKIHYIFFNSLYLQDRLAVVQPQTTSLLTFQIKENQVPFIKQWDNGNMIIWGQDLPASDPT